MTEQTKSDLTRQNILTAGRGLILKHGFSGVGISRILAESNVPKGSFYYYFASKEAFGQALLQDYVDDYLTRVDDLIASTGLARDKLDKFWSAWLPQAGVDGIASQCLVVKLGAEIADLSENMRVILNDGVGELVDRIAILLQQGAADGSLRSFADPQTTAQMLYAKWLGAAILAKLAQDQHPLENALADTATLLNPK